MDQSRATKAVGNKPTRDEVADLYYEIRSLTQELSSGEAKVTKRRSTGAKLLELLSKEKNRSKLTDRAAQNAIEKGHSQAKARRYAASALWTPIISAAFKSAMQLASDGKCKLNADDVKLPLRLLHLSDKSVLAEGNQIKLESTCKIDQKHIKLILKFCFDMLENDVARQLAEIELLNTLLFLCERVDYVAYFRPEEEISNILVLVEGYLADEEEGETEAAAARMFGSLLESCYELGIALHLCMSQCVRLVSRWCKHHMESATLHPWEQSHLFRGLAALIRFHPQQAIKPLTRYGRAILKFVKRSYGGASNVTRHALHGYLIAHLIACQEAGKLKGLYGDLGSLGRASMDREQLNFFLLLVIPALPKAGWSVTVKKRAIWNSLDVQLKRHLDLCARLLAYAQRQYLTQEEWKLLDDPNDFFTRTVKEISKNNNNNYSNIDSDRKMSLTLEQQYPSCLNSVLEQSPWVKHILKPLWQNVPKERKGELQGDASSMSIDNNFSQASASPLALQDNTSQQLQHPMFQCIATKLDNNSTALDPKQLGPLLLIVSACAEAFPSGRCWASSSHGHWFSLAPDDAAKEDILHVHGCSPADFALVVYTISNILEACGGPTGDPEIQILALLCLIRLTQVQGVLASLSADTSAMADIAISWKRVWTALFRSDLRYAAYTASASEGSCGELVLILLTEMVHRWCTDPGVTFSRSGSLKQSTFLYRKQSQIWSLPAFSKGPARCSKPTFELICVFLHRLGLSDEGKDNVQDSSPMTLEGASLDGDRQRMLGRRFRLVCSCLQVLDSVDATRISSRDRELIMVVTACLSALVHGRTSLRTRTFTNGSRNLSWIRSSNTEDLHCRFCFTELPDATVCAVDQESTDPAMSLFTTLWAQPMPDAGMSSLLQTRLIESVTSDVVLSERTRLCVKLQKQDLSSPHMDFVPATASGPLHGLLHSQMKNLLARWTSAFMDNEAPELNSKDEQVAPGDAPLSIKCVWLKAFLGPCVLSTEDTMASGFKQVEGDVVSLFTKLDSILPALCDNRGEFWSVFVDLLQVSRCITRLSSTMPSVELPSNLLKSFSSFMGMCESLLMSFAGENQNKNDQASWEDDNEESEYSSESDAPETKANDLDLLDDSDDDEVVNTRRAPKRKEKRQKSKRKARPSKDQDISPRKKKKRHPRPPDPICASVVGSILMTLDPSVPRFESVIGSLLRAKKDDYVALDQAYHCLSLVNDESVFFHANALQQISASTNPLDESFRHQSPISSACDIIDSLRASTPPSSTLYMYGFQLCGDFVRMGEDDFRGMALTADESKKLVEFLTIDDVSISLRPYLRLGRLQAATNAFENGKDIFHEFIDSIFPKLFVLPSLQDLSPDIRRHSCLAAGAALKALPDKTKVVRGVLNRLPPVRFPSGNEEQRSYQDWYQNLELGSGNMEAENQVWEDALISMEHGAIYCRSVLAGVSSEFTKDMIFDIIKISACRPDLEATCFAAAEKMASMLGYKNVDFFLGDESERMVKMWIESGKTLADIPLLLSSPRLLRHILETGQHQHFMVRRKGNEETETSDRTQFDVATLKDVATDEFVARNRSFVLPQILVRLGSSLEPNGHDGEGQTDSKSLILQDRYIQEFCVCLKNCHDEETVKTLLLGRVHDVEALCAPMTHSENDRLGKRIMKAVSDILSGFNSQHRLQKPYLTIRRILELSGKDKTELFPTHIVLESFKEAIAALVDEHKSKTKGDVLSAAGTSLTECFLYSRLWLEQATTFTKMAMRWSTISLLCDLIFAQIQKKEFKQSQLGFAINIIVDVILNRQLSFIRGKALAMLKRILDQVLGTDESALLKEELHNVSRRLVGSLMKTHEDNQRILVDFCTTKAKTKRRVFKRSLGLLKANNIDLDGGAGDAWGWDTVNSSGRQIQHDDEKFLASALREFHAEAKEEVLDSIMDTYDVLVILFENAEVFGLGFDCFVGCMPPFNIPASEQQALKAVNPRFCAQNVSVHFLEQSSIGKEMKDCLSPSIHSLLEEVSNRFAWMDSLSASSVSSNDLVKAEEGSPSSPLNMTQWMLKAELAQLEHKLRCRRTATHIAEIEALPDEEIRMLIQELSFVCGASCPDILRSAASRCLGELDLRVVRKASTVQSPRESDWVDVAVANDCLLHTVQARAIKVLAEYIHSQNAEVAIAAIDTLIALHATQDGAECFELLDSKARQSVSPVLSSKRRPTNATRTRLSKYQLAAIRRKAGLTSDSSQNDLSWCWNDSLWQCRKETYEDWICTLVPALIECFPRDERNSKSNGNFFLACQMISAIAPAFATKIFPAIVLDLLDRSTFNVASPQSGSRIGAVLEDTWIGLPYSSYNAKLSSCFEVMLGKQNLHSQDPRAIALLLDCLDILRRATQCRFVNSESHKRNSNAVPSQSETAKKTSRNSRGSRSNKSTPDSPADGSHDEDYNKGLGDPILWKGVPFGTVLKLSGDLIVQANIRIQRFASALFYSDLYFEAAFSGSGAVFERLAGTSKRATLSSKTDISGFSVGEKACEASSIRRRAVNSLQLLGECYLQLHEEDAYQAVQRQASDLRFGGWDSIVVERYEIGRVLSPSLADLQRLDSVSNTTTSFTATADTMESLGLRSFLQSYIGSMEWSAVGSMPTHERRMLREKWFESRLYSMNWDKALLNDYNERSPAAESTGDTETFSRKIVLGEIEIPRGEMGFHEAVLNALGAYASDDFQNCLGMLKVARTSLLRPMSTMATGESSFEELVVLAERLQSLNDLEGIAQESDSPDLMLQRWGFSLTGDNAKVQQSISYFSAGFLPYMHETILRLLRCKFLANKTISQQFNPWECLAEHLWNVCIWGRDTKHLNMAEGALQRLRGVLLEGGGTTTTPQEMVLKLRMEEASLRESRGDFSTAIRLAKQTISILQEEKQSRTNELPGVDSLLVDSLISCGSWSSTHKIEPARVILDTYHRPGADLAKTLYRRDKTLENTSKHLKAQLALARLSSAMFDSVSSRVRSLEWIKAGRSLAEREHEYRHCQDMIKESKQKTAKASRSKSDSSRHQQEHLELLAYSSSLKNEIELAKMERMKTEKSLRDFLCLAVKSFLSALAVAGVGQGSDMSRHVFRMVFLWLSHCGEGKEDPELNCIMNEGLGRIPTFRFVPLTSQLFAQIEQKEGSAFQGTLQTLIEKMCTDHPYHCIVQLISMCNGKEVGSGVGGRSATAFLENMSASKVDAASEITHNLERTSEAYVGGLVESYRVLMKAYIQLANAPTTQLVQKNQLKNVPLSLVSKHSHERLDRCLAGRCEYPPCVLTSPPPVRSGRDYGKGLQDPIGGERVAGFESTFSITDSGLHRPKIIICQGSKGGSFRQLCKGEDEIRQDAVMEQVFAYVNELMCRQDDGNSAEKNRDLRMVTYNIVPTSPASGVLEWVENSMTLGDYILDTKTSKGYSLGSHSRYYPGEWGHVRCRTHYTKSPQSEKRNTFDAICSFFSPSFRFFFVERFGHSLNDWYAAKMRYTRSVAVSSMVGHILGIGDRHTNNILVSQLTGEVIHIDFGIVFGQGKLLNVPEVVPFRLTRNIVDGMGPTGTEGTFTKSAEATAVVLRANSNALLTILSAIASDPLYRWSVSPVEARRRQRLTDDEDQGTTGSTTTPRKAAKAELKDDILAITETKTERNEAAALVLSKINEKLQGYEDGTSGEQQSIEGQVQLLINSARDPDNLSVMFNGWAPWI